MSQDALIGAVANTDNALVVRDDVGALYRFVPSGDTFTITKNGSAHVGMKRRTAAKTAAYTVLATDNGTVFTNRGATVPVRFTLPAVSSGLWFDFFAVADYPVEIVGAAGDLLTVFNNATADLISLETSGEIIGSAVRVVCDGTTWFVQMLSNEAATPVVVDSPTAALTGTFLTTPTESEVVTGSQTIIITLTGENWIATGSFNAQRQNIINGLVSAGVEAGGWNAKVKAVMAVGTVVRTSDSIVTITLPATADYSTTENETVTVTVPSSALAHDIGAAIVATPTIAIVSGS